MTLLKKYWLWELDSNQQFSDIHPSGLPLAYPQMVAEPAIANWPSCNIIHPPRGSRLTAGVTLAYTAVMVVAS